MTCSLACFGMGGALGFSPGKVAGNVLWLRADLGVTLSAGISEWADQSGTGDSGKDCFPGSTKPTLNASNFLYGGQKTVDTNGTSDYLQSGTWADVLPQPFTAFFVGHNTAGGTNIGFDNLAAHETAVYAAGGVWNIYAGSALPDVSGVGANNPAAVVAIFNGASSQIYRSQLTGQASGAAGSANMSGTTIGGYGGAPGNTTNSWAGSIAEVALYTGALSPDVIGRLMTYAENRYNLSIGP